MARRTALNVESLERRELLSGLSINLTTDASSYQVGHPVQLTFTETNNSSSPVTIDEGPSNDGFIVEQNGSTVWRSNAGINPLFIVADTLQPGQSLTLTGTWNGIPNVGSSTGTAVTGTFVVLNQLAPATTATFQIDSSSKPASDGSSGSTSSSTAAPILTPVERDASIYHFDKRASTCGPPWNAPGEGQADARAPIALRQTSFAVGGEISPAWDCGPLQ